MVQPTSGIWRVKTLNSVYYLDFDVDGTGLRVGIRIPDDITKFPALRKDGHVFRVHTVEDITVGQSMVMYIVVEDGILTQRTTSPVVGVLAVERGHEVVAGHNDLNIWEQRIMDQYNGENLRKGGD